MKVKDVMSEDVIAVRPDTPLKEVAALLARNGISGVPVIDAADIVHGVVSEADIVAREQGVEPRRGLLEWLLSATYVDLDGLDANTAADVMSSPAITIGAGKQVYEAARLMTDRGVKRLPVVDPSWKIVGIVTRRDLVKAFARSDEDIAGEIADMVRGTLWIEEPSLQIDVHEGVVHVAGAIERRSDAELLPRFIARVPGVLRVESDLSFEWDDRKARLESNPRVPIPPRGR